MKRISRRNFLKVAGVGAAALGLAAVAAASPVLPQPPALLLPLLALLPAVSTPLASPFSTAPTPRLWTPL